MMFKTVKSILMIEIGTFLFALSVGLFILPGKILTGGVAGLTSLLAPYVNISEDILTIGINTFLFLLGSVFLGKNSPEALGDYYAGPNHTLPTMGTARFSSPLSVDDFVKKSQYIYYTNEALNKVSDDIAKFAFSEGLTGHANSVLIRKAK